MHVPKQNRFYLLPHVCLKCESFGETLTPEGDWNSSSELWGDQQASEFTDVRQSLGRSLVSSSVNHEDTSYTGEKHFF